MKKKFISIAGVLAIGSLCFASNGLAIKSDDIESRHIAEADVVSGQDTNSGNGVKTGHIQDGAVTDAKISDVSMGKVTGLQNELYGESPLQGQIGSKADRAYVNNAVANLATTTYVDLAVENPVLPVNYSEPYTCEAADVGAIALSMRFTTCVCNGTDWVSTADGTTSCQWWGTVESAGQIWMDRNLGASQVATSSTDSAAYGDLYQWGRGADGHQKRTSATTTILSTTDDPGHGDFIISDELNGYDWHEMHNDNLWQGVSGINNPCPAGFRLPTVAEINAEKLSWATDDSAGAYGSPLKLPLAGNRNGTVTGNVQAEGLTAEYQTSTVATTWGYGHRIVRFYSGGSSSGAIYARASGASIRCIQD